MSRPLTPLAFAALLGASGCLFDFRNPAEALRAGEASGTVLADRAATGTPTGYPGVSVSLKGSAFDQTTRETGRFAVLDLPVGRHTLLFRKGTTWSLEREVEIAFGKDGQPEGVDLGRVVLRYSAAVEGSFALPAGFSLQAGAVVDETTGQTAALLADAPGSGRATYRFPALNVGTHLFKVGALDGFGGTWVGGQAVVTVTDADQGTTKAVAPITPKAASSSGRLRLRVQAVGDVGAAASAATVDLTPDPLGLNPITPDSQGFVDVTVPEGLYSVVVIPAVVNRTAPAGGPQPLVAAPGVPVAPPVATGVVIEGKVAEVGGVYVVSDLAVAASVRECVTAADCGGLSCVDRLCFDYSPPPGAGANVPFCDACTFQAATGAGTCPVLVSGRPGSCTIEGFCDPGCAGPPCTPDGLKVIGGCAP